jgi:CTP synthase
MKIASTCNVARNAVIDVPDCDSIYKVPSLLHDQKLDDVIVEKLNIWTGSPDLSNWNTIVRRLDKPKHTCKVAVVGKYVDVFDAYKSIDESLIHAGIANECRVDVDYFDSVSMEKGSVDKLLTSYSGVIVPGGFGDRGLEGKIATIAFLRMNKIPFLGICLGMQLAAIEFARNVLGLQGASSIETNPQCAHPIIHLMETQKNLKNLGGTMRLGSYECKLAPNSKALEAYVESTIFERHRHRFEFNNAYREQFEKSGALFSGLSPSGDLVEIMEIKDHPWFLGCQFHPELKSSPMNPHPLFKGFVAAALKKSKTS